MLTMSQCAITFMSLLFIGVYANYTYRTFKPTYELSTVYAKKVIKKVCELIPMKGPCRSEISMVYFDPAEMKCDYFKWGGCQGNGNRFDTIEECEETCLSKKVQSRVLPQYCTLSFDYGFCFGSTNRWYYDPIWKICKTTIYSGCGGNKNNFYSRRDCEMVCSYAKANLRRSYDFGNNNNTIP